MAVEPHNSINFISTVVKVLHSSLGLLGTLHKSKMTAKAWNDLASRILLEADTAMILTVLKASLFAN